MATPTSNAGASRSSSRDAGQHPATALHEAFAHQQIAREIAHQCQFGGDHKIGALRLRRANAADDQRRISRKIARRRIDLEKSDAQKAYLLEADWRKQPDSSV